MPIFNTEYKSYKPIFEYSYDFRNKSMTDVTNEGWGSQTGTINCGASGLYGTNGRLFKQFLDSSQMANAKKITLNATCYISTNYFQVARGLSTANTETNPALLYMYQNNMQFLGYGYDTGGLSKSTWGGLTFSFEIIYDFENKTATLTFTSGLSGTVTGSLTDAGIATGRSNPSYGDIFLDGNAYLQEIYCKIEF